MTYSRHTLSLAVTAVAATLLAMPSVRAEDEISSQPMPAAEQRSSAADEVVVPSVPFSADREAAKTPIAAPVPAAKPTSVVRAASAPKPVVPRASVAAKPATAQAPAAAASVKPIPVAARADAPIPAERAKKACASMLCSTYMVLGVAY